MDYLSSNNTPSGPGRITFAKNAFAGTVLVPGNVGGIGISIVPGRIATIEVASPQPIPTE